MKSPPDRVFLFPQALPRWSGASSQRQLHVFGWRGAHGQLGGSQAPRSHGFDLAHRVGGGSQDGTTGEKVGKNSGALAYHGLPASWAGGICRSISIFRESDNQTFKHKIFNFQILRYHYIWCGSISYHHQTGISFTSQLKHRFSEVKYRSKDFYSTTRLYDDGV